MNDSIETKTVKLKYPFEYHGEQITEIGIRRPKVGDIEALDNVKGESRRSIVLLRHLTGRSDDFIRKFDLVDLEKMTKVLSSFLGGARPTPDSSE